VLLEEYPRVWHRLTWAQRIAYLVRSTFYLIGPLFAAHALFAVYVLCWGSRGAVEAFAQYLVHALPLVIAVLMVRSLANTLWNVQADAVGLKWRGYILACALWPVATGSLIRAVLRRPLPHIATPKRRTVEAHPRLVVAQVALIIAMAIGIITRLGEPIDAALAINLGFAVVVIAIHAYAVAAALRP